MSFSNVRFVFLGMCLALLFLACDGGTRGTGGAKILVLGTIEDRTNAHLGASGILVTGEMLSEEGEILDSATNISAANGSFDLAFEESGLRLSLRFSSSGIDAATILDQLPDNLRRAEIFVELSENEARIVDASFEEQDQSEPRRPGSHGGKSPPGSPTPVVTPDSLPTPAPTLPDVAGAPTATATPDPIASETPTPTETTTPSPTPSETPGNGDQVLICHNPGRHGQTLSVNPNALEAHLDHGDTLGACEGEA